MEHRAEARIDLIALASNISTLKATSKVDLLAVVKADAYGHGLVEIGLAAQKSGADWLGVALLEEAISLRTHGVRIPILAWLVPPGSDFDSATKHDIDVAVASLVTLKEISKLPNKPRIHIEVDTGMTRGGFLDEWDELLKTDFSKVEVVGIFSHFARADEAGAQQNIDQLKDFKKKVEQLKAVGVNPPIKHLSNSAATLLDSASAFDMVRTGIAMYGLTPDAKTMGESKKLGLKPVMQLQHRCHILQLNQNQILEELTRPKLEYELHVCEVKLLPLVVQPLANPLHSFVQLNQFQLIHGRKHQLSPLLTNQHLKQISKLRYLKQVQSDQCELPRGAPLTALHNHHGRCNTGVMRKR